MGQPWIDRCTPDSSRDATKAWLTEALEGSLRRRRIIALADNGTRYDVLMETSRIGCGPEAALLVSFSEATRLEAPTMLCDEVRYEISIAESDFGRLHWSSTSQLRSNDVIEASSATCYEAIYGSDKPCEGCPVRGPGAWPRTLVRIRDRGARGFELLTANRTPEQTAHVQIHRLSDTILSSLVDARIASMCEKAGLSEREMDVLRYLLMGRTLKDIGAILGISIRTVKFHQANVVEKLGADSRDDLIRLIL
ncbi:MAG: helix-turn-helix transcriptional regulator [Polyangiaceae bacterium]|nr:helix-turn-helix transcriptional regulator [Polyangiaceae bacterium]